MRAETVRFTFNDLESLRTAVAAHPGRIARCSWRPRPASSPPVRAICRPIAALDGRRELMARGGAGHRRRAGVPALDDERAGARRARRTLFLAELLHVGLLGQSFIVSAAHTDADVDLTVRAVADALPTYARAIERRATDGLLRGRPVAPALRPHATPRRRAVTIAG